MVIVTYSLYSNIRSLNQLAAGFTQQNRNSKHREEDVNITAQIPQSQADYKPVSIYFLKEGLHIQVLAKAVCMTSPRPVLALVVGLKMTDNTVLTSSYA